MIGWKPLPASKCGPDEQQAAGWVKPEKPEQNNALDEPAGLLGQQFLQPELRRLPFGVIELSPSKRAEAS